MTSKRYGKSVKKTGGPQSKLQCISKRDERKIRKNQMQERDYAIFKVIVDLFVKAMSIIGFAVDFCERLARDAKDNIISSCEDTKQCKCSHSHGRLSNITNKAACIVNRFIDMMAYKALKLADYILVQQRINNRQLVDSNTSKFFDDIVNPLMIEFKRLHELRQN